MVINSKMQIYLKKKSAIHFLIVFFLTHFHIHSENLIKNPGFEEEKQSLPTHWSLFVQPQEGSFGKVDKKAYHSGKSSVMLTNKNNYEKEPINNWNQRITKPDNKEIKEIYFEGWIKTEEILKAYYLLQFWNQNPAYILGSTKSEILTGTNDWKKVTINSTMPPETDFIMVRCAIEGTGTAWFDNVYLDFTSNQQNEENKSINKNLEEGIKKIEQKLEELLKENRELKEKMVILEEENKKMREQLEKIKEIDKKEDIQTKTNEKQETINVEKPPILIPHKKNWQKVKE